MKEDMSKGSGGTRAKNSSTAHSKLGGGSMKSSTQKQIPKQSVIAGPGGTKYSGITKAEMNSVLGVKKLKRNANVTINIGNDSYHVSSSPSDHGKTVVSVMMRNGYSLYRDTYTSSGSY